MDEASAGTNGLLGTGYTEDILATLEESIAAAAGPTDIQEDDPGPLIDKAAELQKKWGTERGQLWEIGKHRLMCGDATAQDDVTALLHGAKPFLMVTDPPYGVNYDPAWRSKAAEEGHLAYAAIRIGKVTNDDRSDWKAAWDCFPGDVVYSWHPAGATSKPRRRETTPTPYASLPCHHSLLFRWHAQRWACHRQG